jgi:hypothetical protein
VIILPRRDNDIKISVTKAGPPPLAAPFFWGACHGMTVPGYRGRADGGSLHAIPKHRSTAGVTRPRTAPDHDNSSRKFQPNRVRAGWPGSGAVRGRMRALLQIVVRSRRRGRSKDLHPLGATPERVCCRRVQSNRTATCRRRTARGSRSAHGRPGVCPVRGARKPSQSRARLDCSLTSRRKHRSRRPEERPDICRETAGSDGLASAPRRHPSRIGRRCIACRPPRKRPARR